MSNNAVTMWITAAVVVVALAFVGWFWSLSLSNAQDPEPVRCPAGFALAQTPENEGGTCLQIIALDES